MTRFFASLRMTPVILRNEVTKDLERSDEGFKL